METVIMLPESKGKEKIPFKINDNNQILFFESNKDEYVLSMQIAGLKKNNIEITTEKNVLHVHSTEDTRHIDRIISINDRCIYDMHQLNFSFALPSDADVKMAKANCCEETLIIYFPKKIKAYRPFFLKIPVA
jgi:HSP20 family molecular chaperone IbpA